MTLKLYNTLTRTKEEFKPLDPKNVRMYVCGPTVYDYAHIGNARPVIVFDVLFRLLRHLYGAAHVTYVRNITDIDDKINARAKEEGTSIRELTERTYSQFRTDIAALGVLEPTYEPRATETIPEMITIIQRLIASGHAYPAEGHVLFSVPSMKDYGQLSRRPLDEMIAGARVDVAPYKRDAMDFVLWKPSDAETPGWESPWGRGRPGWHVECSAMSWKHLGEVFDIHGGGIDLVFPHHENELAQTRCAFGHGVMANIWMHNGFLQVESQKMSKSLGNFVTINELLKTEVFGGRKWSGATLRLAMLQTHYTQPIDWTVKQLEQAELRRQRWLTFATEMTLRKTNHSLMNAFISALSDDLNTPAAFAIVEEAIDGVRNNDENRFTVFQILNLLGIRRRKTRVAEALSAAQGVLKKLEMFSPNDWENMRQSVYRDALFADGSLKTETKLFAQLQAVSRLSEELIGSLPTSTVVRQEVEKIVQRSRPKQAKQELRVSELVEARLAARRDKNWAESDRIRDVLLAEGYVLKDNKDGTTSWEKVKR